MKVIPIDGRSVPDPARGDLLPESGRNVEPSSYWLARIAAGDVREEPPANEVPPPDSDTSAPKVTTKRSRKS
jgi:hypothetical protein